MSRIKLQGNPGGTGTLTLASPDTNSDFTLNLPAASGVVQLEGAPATFSTLAVNGNNISAVNSMGFRNRIINGDMGIDQRNAGGGASIGPSTSQDYRVDRFFFQRFGGSAVIYGARSGDVPAGFVKSLSATVSTSAAPVASNTTFIRQLIEGFNVGDLGFGTANAQAVTLSFWVKSSVTGTQGGSVTNGGFTRSYVFTYTISAANTWEYKTITVPGDTSGTWTTDNSAGMRVNFDLGSGPDLNGTADTWASASVMRTSACVNWIANAGATFYITGVQLEAGSVATPFERRDYGRELMMCQRYYVRQAFNTAGVSSLSDARYYFPLVWPVTMRSTPTVAWVSGGDVSTGLPRGAITSQVNTVGGSPSSIIVGLNGPTVAADGTGAVTYNNPIFQMIAEL